MSGFRPNHARQVPRGDLEAAAYWVMRLEGPNCGPADRAAFEAWRTESEDHATAFAQARDALGTLDRHLTHPELTALGERVFETTRVPRLRLLQRGAAGLAAGVAVLLGAALYWQDGPEPVAPASQALAASSFETAVGERSTVELSDDSTITLNTDSRISVHFTERSPTRRLTLERGEAHFQVAKDPRPFEVFAGDRRIVALGTAFDVRLLPDQDSVLVTLVEGRVRVDAVNPADTAPGRPPGKRPPHTQLEAGEQLLVKPNEPPTVIEADLERAAGWREGRLLFRDQALPDAVSEINRYSRRKLVVDDDARLDAIRISGVFLAGSTRSFIEAVETVHPVKAHPIAWDRIELFWLDREATYAEPHTGGAADPVSAQTPPYGKRRTDGPGGGGL